jgi:hypothetical protein
VSWHAFAFSEESYMKWAVYFMALIRNFDRGLQKPSVSGLNSPPFSALFGKERMEANRCLKWLEQRKSITTASCIKNYADSGPN